VKQPIDFFNSSLLYLAYTYCFTAQTPGVTTTNSDSPSTTLPGASTTQPGASTTIPGVQSTTIPGGSTTIPGVQSTTIPGGSTTIPGVQSTTIPGASSLTTQPVSYNSANNQLSASSAIAAPSSSWISGTVQSTVVVQTGQNGAASSVPLSGMIQSTISGQSGGQTTIQQTQVNTNLVQTASQQQSTNVQPLASSISMQSQMPTSNLATSSILPIPSSPQTNAATGIVQSSSSGGTQQTKPVTDTGTQQYSSPRQSSLLPTSATQNPSQAAFSQQQQSNFPSSQASYVLSTLKPSVASSFFGSINTQQSTWPSAQAATTGQTFPSGLTTLKPETPKHVQVFAEFTQLIN
jgi:hypothetical protein